MANLNTPIPQNPIGENFVWRDWFQKLSNRVYGSLSTQESTNVSITGGAIDGTTVGAAVPSTGHFTSLQLNSPLALLYGGTASNTASGARITLGVTATGSDTTYNYRANNLSDVANVVTARTNLGVTATGSDTTYAYRANNLSDLASASTARTNLGVTATGSDTTYLYRANNLSDLTSASTARTNLGVTATGADTTYAYRSNNLSDLASASTARTNLGLGSMATQNTGISTTVALAKLTLAGSNGSLTVSNGIITAYTAPT